MFHGSITVFHCLIMVVPCSVRMVFCSMTIVTSQSQCSSVQSQCHTVPKLCSIVRLLNHCLISKLCFSITTPHLSYHNCQSPITIFHCPIAMPSVTSQCFTVPMKWTPVSSEWLLFHHNVSQSHHDVQLCHLLFYHSGPLFHLNTPLSYNNISLSHLNTHYHPYVPVTPQCIFVLSQRLPVSSGCPIVPSQFFNVPSTCCSVSVP